MIELVDRHPTLITMGLAMSVQTTSETSASGWQQTSISGPTLFPHLFAWPKLWCQMGATDWQYHSPGALQ